MKEFNFMNGCELEATKEVFQLLEGNPFCHTWSMYKEGDLEKVCIGFKDISGEMYLLEWYSNQEDLFEVYSDLTDIDFGMEFYDYKLVKDVVEYLNSLPHFRKI